MVVLVFVVEIVLDVILVGVQGRYGDIVGVCILFVMVQEMIVLLVYWCGIFCVVVVIVLLFMVGQVVYGVFVGCDVKIGMVGNCYVVSFGEWQVWKDGVFVMQWIGIDYVFLWLEVYFGCCLDMQMGSCVYCWVGVVVYDWDVMVLSYVGDVYCFGDVVCFDYIGYQDVDLIFGCQDVELLVRVILFFGGDWDIQCFLQCLIVCDIVWWQGFFEMVYVKFLECVFDVDGCLQCVSVVYVCKKSDFFVDCGVNCGYECYGVVRFGIVVLMFVEMQFDGMIIY